MLFMVSPTAHISAQQLPDIVLQRIAWRYTVVFSTVLHIKNAFQRDQYLMPEDPVTDLSKGIADDPQKFALLKDYLAELYKEWGHRASIGDKKHSHPFNKFNLVIYPAGLHSANVYSPSDQEIENARAVVHQLGPAAIWTKRPIPKWFQA